MIINNTLHKIIHKPFELFGESGHRFINGIICKLGIYYQYQVGHCGWCGKPHVKAKRQQLL